MEVNIHISAGSRNAASEIRWGNDQRLRVVYFIQQFVSEMTLKACTEYLDIIIHTLLISLLFCILIFFFYALIWCGKLS